MAKKTMTYEEAIRRINNVLDPYPAFPSLPVETCEAIEMALTALKEKAEAESKAKNHPSGKTDTNEDVIYRKDAISAIRECYIKEVTPAYRLIDKTEALSAILDVEAIKTSNDDVTKAKTNEDVIYRKDAVSAIKECYIKEVTPAYRLIDKAEALSAILGVEAIKASNDDVTAGQPHPEPYKKDMDGINGLIDMQMAIDTAIEAVDAWDGGHNAERAEIIKRYFVENIPNDMPINPDYISRQAAIKECVKGKVEGSPATNLACDLCAERIKNLLPKWTDIINRHDAIEECLNGKSIELPAASLACQNCAERINLLPSIRKCIDDGNCIRYYCDLFEEKRKTTVQDTKDDCISRQAAINAALEDVSDKRTHEFNAGAIRAANRIKSLPSAQPEQRWIPVTERLPENDNEVLITVWDAEDDYVEVYKGFYQGHEWWTQWCHGCSKIKDEPCGENIVIAWMPLPEPYKGGEM